MDFAHSWWIAPKLSVISIIIEGLMKKYAYDSQFKNISVSLTSDFEQIKKLEISYSD